MSIDIDPYRHHLDGFDLTEDQKADIIRSVHLVMESFVDLAFGTDSTQISLGIDRDDRALSAADTVDLNDPMTPTFNDAADETAAGKTIP